MLQPQRTTWLLLSWQVHGVAIWLHRFYCSVVYFSSQRDIIYNYCTFLNFYLLYKQEVCKLLVMSKDGWVAWVKLTRLSTLNVIHVIKYLRRSTLFVLQATKSVRTPWNEANVHHSSLIPRLHSLHSYVPHRVRNRACKKQKLGWRPGNEAIAVW